MSQFIDTEAMTTAAYRMRDAAMEANRAADRLESVLHQLRLLTEDGYGNNVTTLIELLRETKGTA